MSSSSRWARRSWGGALGAATCLATCLAGSPARAQVGVAPADDGAWHFDVSVPLWAAGLKGTVSLKGLPEQPVEATLSDVMKHFDIGVFSHFEGRKGRAGFGTDVLYLNLGADLATDRPVLGQIGLQADVRQLQWESFGFYRLAKGGPEPGNPASADVLVGFRYTGVTARIEGDAFEGTKRTFGWVDGMFGLRGYAPFGKKAGLRGRGDIAGFGSDFTWQLEGALTLRASEHWSFDAGYRYLDVDYDKGTGVDRKLYKVATRGPVLIVRYAW
jgi:hypothetical protein